MTFSLSVEQQTADVFIQNREVGEMTTVSDNGLVTAFRVGLNCGARIKDTSPDQT